jgi:hypothetical protein
MVDVGPSVVGGCVVDVNAMAPFSGDFLFFSFLSLLLF